MTDNYTAPLPKFSLGRIVMTESAMQTLLHNDIATALSRCAEIEDKIEASRQDLDDKLGDVREDIKDMADD